jgi:hypothetical protein
LGKRALLTELVLEEAFEGLEALQPQGAEEFTAQGQEPGVRLLFIWLLPVVSLLLMVSLLFIVTKASAALSADVLVLLFMVTRASAELFISSDAFSASGAGTLELLALSACSAAALSSRPCEIPLFERFHCCSASFLLRASDDSFLRDSSPAFRSS